jgi:hypothetical protein
MYYQYSKLISPDTLARFFETSCGDVRDSHHEQNCVAAYIRQLVAQP